MLLDLNVGIISGDYSTGDETMSVIVAAEESPTSTSSVLSADDGRNNAAEGNFSSTDTSPLVFDVFRKETETQLVNALNPAPEFVSRQVFPFSGDGELGFSAPAKTQWLNLSFVGPVVDSVQQKQQPARKSRRGPRSRSSQYRGVTFYRRTGRWESHIWDCGKQVYLGGFDTAHSAARAYDRAAIKFRGIDADINFNLTDYEENMKQTQNLNKEEFVLTLRRQSTSYVRGSSKYRGNEQFFNKMTFNKASMQCIKKEVTVNDAEIVITENLGNCHDLDLSLGMSVSSNGRNGEMLTRKGKMNPILAGEFLNGLPVASKRSWSSIYPGFFPTYEGRGAEKAEAVTSPSLAWYNNGGTTSALPVYSIAASSGFDSSNVGNIHRRPVFKYPS